MKLFVIVDYQRDFVFGSLGFSGAESLDGKILLTARQAHENGYAIVVTRDTHHSNYLETREGKTLPVPHTIYGTSGWELYGETGKWLHEATARPALNTTQMSDSMTYVREGGQVRFIFINKATFGCNPQDMMKLSDGVTEIAICGLVSNMCVLSNVCCFQARYPEAQITVLSDLCDSFDPSLHSKTLDILRGIQVHVTESLNFMRN